MQDLQIEHWLKALGLEEHAHLFTENRVTFEMLPNLSNDDLKDMGIARLGDRKIILQAIEQNSQTENTEDDPSPAAHPAAERRQVSVLFSDLSGFTKLSSEIGAEATHELLNRYFETVDAAVENYGGRVDKHIGDSVMAVFGAPVAHDDDPLRAVHTALAIHEHVAKLSIEIGRQVRSHVGIASGQVVASSTGSNTHNEYTVTGDSVNLASRLQDRAKPGETLISDELYRMVNAHVQGESLGEVQVKGLDETVNVWRVNSLIDDNDSSSMQMIVGRHSELAQFSGVLQSCKTHSNGQVIVVRGDAGMGKTRLVEEFQNIAQSEGFSSCRGQILSFGEGSSQSAVQSIVKALMSQTRDAEKSVLCEFLNSTSSPVTTEQIPFVMDLLELPMSAQQRSNYDAMDNMQRSQGKHEVIADLLYHATRLHPVLIIVEDIHWADSLTLSYLSRLAQAIIDVPALLITTTRPEGDPLDSTWRGKVSRCPIITIDLGPLRQEDAMQLATMMLDDADTMVLECVRRADGNPLFLEQLLKNCQELGSEDLPPSIQSLVLARIDRLPAVDKDALQAASVLGQRFSLSVLCQLSDDPDYQCDEVVKRQLIKAEGNEFMFTHALVREGVYGSLLSARRKQLHLRAANLFADTDPVLHAYHLDHADDPGAAPAYLAAANSSADNYLFESVLNLSPEVLSWPVMPQPVAN